MPTHPSDGRPSFVRALLAAFLAGQIVGVGLFLAGVARHGEELSRMPPSAGVAIWVAVRSLGTYSLLTAAVAALLAAVFYLLCRLIGRGQRLAPAVGFSLTAAGVILFQLTSWRQIELFSGLPLDHPARLPAALIDTLYALAGGTALFVLARVLARRLGPPRRWSGRAGAARAALLLLPFLAIVAADFALRLKPPAHTGPWRPTQIAVVGLDAATLRVLGPMMREGRLPTFRRLVDEGAWGTLLTYGVDSSPMIWTSVATGKRVRDHGIDNWIKPRPQGAVEPMKSSDRKVQAIWNIAGRLGRRVGVVNWLITYPPEEVNGYVVSRLDVEETNRTYPPELNEQIVALVTGDATGGDPLRARLFSEIRRSFEVSRHLLDRDRIDLLLMFEAATDNLQHNYWRHYEPEKFSPELWDPVPESDSRLGELIPDSYELIDEQLRSLWQELDEDALLVVVSDHGQLAAESPPVWFDLNRLLAELGELSFGEGEPRQVDFGATRAYAMVQSRWVPKMKINLNIEGRERQGIVPPREARRLLDRLVTTLRDLEFEDGTALFGPVERAPTIEAADRDPGRADITVMHSRFTRSYRFAERRIVLDGRSHRLGDFLTRQSELSGEHDRKGVIFLHGKGVRRGFLGQRVVSTALQEIVWRLTDKVDLVDAALPWLRAAGLLERASTLDVTPTILYAFGLPVAEDMAGRPLTEAVETGEPVDWIATYEIPEAYAEGEQESESDEELLQRLRALGYIQ